MEIGTCCQILGWILLSPLLLVAYLLFLVLWLLFTITGIGPIIQWCYTQRDLKLLNREQLLRNNSDIHLIQIPKGIHSATRDAYTVAVRFTKPLESQENIKKYPICIPNGLGATIVTISILHEALVQEGYAVLSFDRLGVGFSVDNPTGISPTAEDVVHEMNYIMEYVLPEEKNWILIGPSMGSIISQCYMAVYPEKVSGFLNIDGLPYPFSLVRGSFEKAALIYKFYTYVIWTGLFRPFIGYAISRPEMKWLSSTAFPLQYSIAQMNQSKFYGNLALEMLTMMSCCDYVGTKWGKWNIVEMEPQVIARISQYQPYENIETDQTKFSDEQIIDRKLTIYRSPSEVGQEWISRDQLIHLLDEVEKKSNPIIQLSREDTKDPTDGDGLVSVNDSSLQESLLSTTATATATISSPSPEPSSTFLDLWQHRLIVRVLSGRNHDYGNSLMNKFYTQEMKNYAGAEHVLHAHLARDGKRRVYPHLNHMKMFAQIHEILLSMKEINDILMTEKI